MGHLKKESTMCQAPWLNGPGKVSKCRLVARRVMFGRVPRSVVHCLGLCIVALAVWACLWSFVFMKPSTPYTARDLNSVVIIRR
jgi:hypothetical protein